MTTNMPQQANGCVLLFMGIIFAVAGFSVIYWGGQEEHFTCYRANNVCIMEKKKIFDDKKEKMFQLPLSSIKNAIVKSHDDNDGGVTYRAYLVTDENKIPLSTSSSSDYSGHSEKVQKINSYLNSQEDKLEIIDKNTIIKVFGGVFFGAGLLMLLGAIGSSLKLILALFYFLTGRR